MNRIPGNSLDPSDGGLTQTLDTEGSNLIEDRPPVLESVIGVPGGRAERLSTNLALVATMLSPPGFVESVTDDVCGGGFPGQGAWLVWTAETLHGSWTLMTLERMASN